MGAPGAYYQDIAELSAALDAGAPCPAVLVLPCVRAVDADVVASAHLVTKRALAALQAFVANEALASCSLLIVTRGAVAAAPHDRLTGLPHATLWGLVRAAKLELPLADIQVLDLQHEPTASGPELFEAALASREPQLAVRDGELRAPRLARKRAQLAPEAAPWSQRLAAEGTVLITGGTGAIGALLAKHLVAQHGVRHLVLCSRSGGGEALCAELQASGASVSVAACDISERAQVAQLLAAIDPAHPLTAVFHSAVALADGIWTGPGTCTS
jgi:hypothetical protein